MQNWDTSQWTGQVLSFFGMVGSILGILPALAGGAACVYYCIQIYESETVKKAVLRWRARRLQGRITMLRETEFSVRSELSRIDQDYPGVQPACTKAPEKPGEGI